MSDDLSRLPRKGMSQSNLDDSFPDERPSDNSVADAGPIGPVLDGVLLDHLTPAGVHGQHDEWLLSALLTDMVVYLAGYRTRVISRTWKLTSSPSQNVQH